VDEIHAECGVPVGIALPGEGVTMRRSVITLFAAALLLAWAHGVAAQTPCEDALRESEKSYELGLFEDVPQQIASCLGARISRPLAIQVHSLLARAYLQNEEVEKAHREVSTLLRLDSTFEAGPSPRFAALVAQVRREELTTQVASVSKTSESLREAPATVIVITGDEIQRRGYLDLDQLLHDLPGFDISRLNGASYSTIYQRGYNAAGNDRNLLLVDGIEQNDLSFGSVFLSRQYPLTNIDRVEVIYGPASTMYGANAYTGVISIITKTPEALAGEGRAFGLTGQLSGGGYGGGSVDVSAAGRDRSGTLAWSLTGIFQKSKERDLSAFSNWDYSYRDVDYKSLMRLPGTAVQRAVLCGTSSPYIHCDSSGIALTDEGERVVRELDSNMVRDTGTGFDDRAQNWSVNGKLRIANLTLGLQSWRSAEGIGSAYGRNYGGQTDVVPRETAIYMKYSLPVGAVKLNVFSRYEQTSREKAQPALDILHTYADTFLSLYSLVAPCKAQGDPIPVGCAPANPWVERIQLGSLSNQFVSEINATWDSSEKLTAVGGIELTKSSIQSEYDQTGTGPGALITLPLEKPEQIEHTDIALYAQGSWKPRPSLKLVLAGRLTDNEIVNKPGASGFGALFTPRAAVIYSPSRKRLVLKAIYSEAFKDPTDAQKFGVLFQYLNAYRSNGLRPERVRNIELNAGWEPTERLAAEAAVYQAKYSDVVAFGYPLQPDGSPVQGCFLGCQQYQNRDEVRVRGIQLTGHYRLAASSELWANYTHTEPFQTNPRDFFGNPLVDPQGQRIDKIREHGIASDRANVGVETTWFTRLRAGARLHYVGPRPLGPGTTLPTAPISGVDAYTSVDATVSYVDVLPNMTLQLTAFNLFDKTYYDPATDEVTVPRVPQAGRTVYLRLIYRLP
jgi:outer membrane receptor protein involved in Fe transport